MSEYGYGRWDDIRSSERQGTGAKGMSASGAFTAGHMLVVGTGGAAEDGGAPLALVGDLGGTGDSPIVTGIQGIGVSETDPTDGQVLQYVASSPGGEWTPKSPPFLVVCYITGKPEQSGVLVDFTPPLACSFPEDLAGSTVRVGTNPTSTATYSLQKNGSEFGTLAIATDGTPTWTSESGASFNGTSDYLTVVAPASQDDTLAGVGITLKGTR